MFILYFRNVVVAKNPQDVACGNYRSKIQGDIKMGAL